MAKTKKTRFDLSGLFMSVGEIVVGILLLINPIGFTSGIIIAAGIAMMLFGLLKVIQYFRSDAAEAAQKFTLSFGILGIILGCFCTLKSSWFIAAFPMITVLYGILILAGGITKLQKSIDLLRLKQKYWFVALISAALALVFAILILVNPFASTAFLWSFIGISLIVEAIMDVLTFIFSRVTDKSQNE